MSEFPEISEALVTTIEKVKKSRTPAQLETLCKAREKASVVRMQNAELRRKQTEVDKAAATEVKRQRVEKLQREYDAVVVETATPQGAVDHTSDEEVVERVAKHRPKKKRVIVVEESSSEDEIEIRLPKQKKPQPEIPLPPPDLKQERYNKLYQKMFALE